MIAVGSCHGDLTESFLQIMMERDASDLGKTHVRYLALALALLYLGKQEAAELTVEALKVIPEPLCSFATTLLDVCAYAGQCVCVHVVQFWLLSAQMCEWSEGSVVL